VRKWVQKFGGIYAKWLRSRAARPGDHWHLDKVYLLINGKRQYLWRAVDQDDKVLNILVQPRRNKKQRRGFFVSCLKDRGAFLVPSSLTSLVVRRLLKLSYCLISNISRTNAQTIEQKVRINQRENVNAERESSNQRGTFQDFVKALVLLHHSSAQNVIF
jgi:transposase-like protein